MVLHRQDHITVVADLPQAQNAIRQGLGIVRRTATIGGLKAQKSEQFLHKLIRATLRRTEKVCMTASWVNCKLNRERRSLGRLPVMLCRDTRPSHTNHLLHRISAPIISRPSTTHHHQTQSTHPPDSWIRQASPIYIYFRIKSLLPATLNI